MLKVTLTRKIINLSDWIQTCLINYLEFHSAEPKEKREKGYESFSPISKPNNPYQKPFQKEDVIKPHYLFLFKLAKKHHKPIKPVCRKNFFTNKKEILWKVPNSSRIFNKS